MARQTITNGQGASSVRSALNDNFTELYDAIVNTATIVRLDAPPNNFNGYRLGGSSGINGEPNIEGLGFLLSGGPTRWVSEDEQFILDIVEGTWFLSDITDSHAWAGVGDAPETATWTAVAGNAEGTPEFIPVTQTSGHFAISPGQPPILWQNLGNDALPYWTMVSADKLALAGGTLEQGASISMHNGSRLKAGDSTINHGGNGGIAFECWAGYDLQWEAGRLYAKQSGADQIQRVDYQWNPPSAYDDETQGYVTDSWWVTRDNRHFVCTDATEGAAVWVQANTGGTYSGTIGFVPITSTPTGTTQTIDLNAGNHQQLVLTSTTGNLALTLTVPTAASAGTITVYQHASTAREITVTVSSGSAFWAGTKPTFASDAAASSRVLAWVYNGFDLTLSPGPVRVAN